MKVKFKFFSNFWPYKNIKSNKFDTYNKLTIKPLCIVRYANNMFKRFSFGKHKSTNCLTGPRSNTYSRTPQYVHIAEMSLFLSQKLQTCCTTHKLGTCILILSSPSTLSHCCVSNHRKKKLVARNKNDL